MNIGVIGYGMVGKAITRAFRELNHIVLVNDINYDFQTLKEVVDTSELIFLCVPTPPASDGSCDTSIVEEVLDKISKYEYKGVVAIKSTVIPGTTDRFQKWYKNLVLCHVPEFLREKYGYEDFTLNHNNLVVGSSSEEVANLVIKAHGHYPKNVTLVKPVESELIKYFSNTFKAYKTLFACSFGSLCDSLGVDYGNVLKGYLKENVSEDKYLKYSPEFKGYGGACLPKDVNALAKFIENNTLNIDTFNFLKQENSKYC